MRIRRKGSYCGGGGGGSGGVVAVVIMVVVIVVAGKDWCSAARALVIAGLVDRDWVGESSASTALELVCRARGDGGVGSSSGGGRVGKNRCW